MNVIILWNIPKEYKSLLTTKALERKKIITYNVELSLLFSELVLFSPNFSPNQNHFLPNQSCFLPNLCIFLPNPYRFSTNLHSFSTNLCRLLRTYAVYYELMLFTTNLCRLLRTIGMLFCQNLTAILTKERSHQFIQIRRAVEYGNAQHHRSPIRKGLRKLHPGGAVRAGSDNW